MEISWKNILFSLFMIGVLFLLIVAGIFYFFLSQFVGGNAVPNDSLAVIEVNGAIIDNNDSFGSNQANASVIMSQINQAKKDSNIKGMLLKVNSPGGSSAASDAIYRELTKFSTSGKPLVVSMGDAAASGGYYISTPANKIYANSATMTGSIGVIMQFTNLEELYNKLGVEYITIKSRKYKDIGNPDRKMTEEEKEILQSMVEDVYENFVQVVKKERNMTLEKVKELADGRIYTGEQAKELGLIDELGTFYDAIDELSNLANIDGDPNLVYYNQSSTLDRILKFSSKGDLFSWIEEIREDNRTQNRYGLFYF